MAFGSPTTSVRAMRAVRWLRIVREVSRLTSTDGACGSVVGTAAQGAAWR